MPGKAWREILICRKVLRQRAARGQAGGERGGAFEDGVYRVKRLSLLANPLLNRPGRTGQLHEEQGGAILPGGFHAWVESQLSVEGGGEGASLHEGDESGGGLHAEMVVEGEEEGIPAATAVKAAVIAAAKTRGGETGGELGPGMPGGHFPDNGIQQEARGGAGTARGRSLPARLQWQAPSGEGSCKAGKRWRIL